MTLDTSYNDKFVEQMGLIFARQHHPRISGRLFGLLYIEQSSHSITQIAERLGVSKASISTNARALQRNGIIKQVSKSGDRQDYYEISEALFIKLLSTQAIEAQSSSVEISEIAQAMPVEMAETRERIEKLAFFYNKTAGFFESLAQDLHRNNSPAFQNHDTNGSTE